MPIAQKPWYGKLWDATDTLLYCLAHMREFPDSRKQTWALLLKGKKPKIIDSHFTPGVIKKAKELSTAFKEARFIKVEHFDEYARADRGRKRQIKQEAKQVRDEAFNGFQNHPKLKREGWNFFRQYGGEPWSKYIAIYFYQCAVAGYAKPEFFEELRDVFNKLDESIPWPFKKAGLLKQGVFSALANECMAPLTALVPAPELEARF